MVMVMQMVNVEVTGDGSIKAKLALKQTMNAQRRSRRIALLFL